jgi:hypothetical protein
LRRPLEPGQYLSIRYTERLAEAGAVTSVGSRGDSYDNALAETIIGLYKTELVRRRGPWKGIDDLEYATLEWVDWFNHRRLLEPIGHVPPAEFEAAFRREENLVRLKGPEPPMNPGRFRHQRYPTDTHGHSKTTVGLGARLRPGVGKIRGSSPNLPTGTDSPPLCVAVGAARRPAGSWKLRAPWPRHPPDRMNRDLTRSG